MRQIRISKSRELKSNQKNTKTKQHNNKKTFEDVTGENILEVKENGI